jgi:hypothetical protein
MVKGKERLFIYIIVRKKRPLYIYYILYNIYIYYSKGKVRPHYIHIIVRGKRGLGKVKAVPWLRSLFAGLSPPWPVLSPGSIHMRFVVDKLAVGQVCLRVLRLSPVNVSFQRRSSNSYNLRNA